MATDAQRRCRRSGCKDPVPPAMAGDELCVNHFLDQAHVRAADALETCQNGGAVGPDVLDWLIADAEVTLKALAARDFYSDSEQQARVLELLLCVANLHEYMAHHSDRVVH
jgi:hypothetical protein